VETTPCSTCLGSCCAIPPDFGCAQKGKFRCENTGTTFGGYNSVCTPTTCPTAAPTAQPSTKTPTPVPTPAPTMCTNPGACFCSDNQGPFGLTCLDFATTPHQICSPDDCNAYCVEIGLGVDGENAWQGSGTTCIAADLTYSDGQDYTISACCLFENEFGITCLHANAAVCQNVFGGITNAGTCSTINCTAILTTNAPSQSPTPQPTLNNQACCFSCVSPVTCNPFATVCSDQGTEIPCTSGYISAGTGTTCSTPGACTGRCLTLSSNAGCICKCGITYEQCKVQSDSSNGGFITSFTPGTAICTMDLTGCTLDNTLCS
jgi:hypothetical protein